MSLSEYGPAHLPGRNVMNKQHYSFVLPIVKRPLSLEPRLMSILQGGCLKGQYLEGMAQS